MSRLAKEILVIGFNETTNRSMIKYHFDCDTVSDLPTLAEGIAQNVDIAMTSTAHVIETDEDYEMKSNGVWVKQKGEFELSLDAAAIDYDNTTSGMAADNIQDAIDEIHAATETQGTAIAGLQTQNTSQQNEIDYAINTGAKNIINNTANDSRVVAGVTWTKNSDGSMTANGTTTGVSAVRVVGVQGSSSYANAVPIPRGQYIISPSGYTDEVYRFAIGIFADDQSARTTRNIYNTPITIDIDSDTARYDFSAVISRAGVTVSDLVFQPMIRRAEITDDTFEPYAPSNRELYEMILQLQSAAGLRTVSTLRSAAAPLKNETEEEVTEDEER